MLAKNFPTGVDDDAGIVNAITVPFSESCADINPVLRCRRAKAPRGLAAGHGFRKVATGRMRPSNVHRFGEDGEFGSRGCCGSDQILSPREILLHLTARHPHLYQRNAVLHRSKFISAPSRTSS